MSAKPQAVGSLTTTGLTEVYVDYNKGDVSNPTMPGG